MNRSAAEIGQGLAPAREPRPIRAGERIHVIGAAGAGASAAALLAARAGGTVTGCDRGAPSPYTAALDALGIRVAGEHSPEHLRGPDGRAVERLAVTKALTAVEPDHPELGEARRLGIAAEPWQQLVADAAASRSQALVAVAGTHGKSTTAGWLVHLLVTAGRDPSAFVGALLEPSLTGGAPSTARWGDGQHFVVEADEYAGNFDAYRPAIALLLNAEWDHPDVFADEAAVVDALAGWLERASAAVDQLSVVANLDDAGVAQVIGRLGSRAQRIVGVRSRIIRQGAAGSEVLVTVDHAGQRYMIGLPGAHNAANGALVAAVGQLLGIDQDAIAGSLASFGGVGRRMEVKGEVGGVTVIDDYAHHPTAIARTLEAVRQIYPRRRVWAVYEPLTYHRTAVLLEHFAAALGAADAVAIADIWAGRDPDTTITSAAALAEAVSRGGGPTAVAPGSVEATADHLAAAVAPGDVVLVMGGGRSHVIAERLVSLLRARAVPAT